MGDEHGRKVLVPCSLCEEPSAAVGFPCLRPAAACRRGICRRLRGGLSAGWYLRTFKVSARNTAPSEVLPFPLIFERIERVISRWGRNGFDGDEHASGCMPRPHRTSLKGEK